MKYFGTDGIRGIPNKKLTIELVTKLGMALKTFLEEYVEFLVTLRIMSPGVMISSCISVIKYNCYKKTNDL